MRRSYESPYLVNRTLDRTTLGDGNMNLLNKEGYADAVLQFASQIKPNLLDSINLDCLKMFYLQNLGVNVSPLTRKWKGTIKDTSFSELIQRANDREGLEIADRISEMRRVLEKKNYELVVINEGLNFEQAWQKIR